MEPIRPDRLVRVHLSEPDKHQGRPLYEGVVEKCREMSIAGATVFQALEGYGESAEIHRSHLLSHDLPIVVTIVDKEENIRRLLAVIEEMTDTALMAISDVEAFRIRRDPTEPSK